MSLSHIKKVVNINDSEGLSGEVQLFKDRESHLSRSSVFSHKLPADRAWAANRRIKRYRKSLRFKRLG